jgi:adenylate cyclase class IV
MIIMLAAMGLKKGIMAERRGNIYTYKGIEFSVVEVPDHSYYFEAEQMVTNMAEQKEASKNIEKICQELGLKPLSQQEFFDYINRLNNEANEVFDFSQYAEGYFHQRFGI